MAGSSIDLTWLTVLVVALVGFTIGLTKGGFNGLGGILTPLLSLVLPNVALAVGILLPLLIVGDLFALRVYWRAWDKTILRRTFPGALVGVVLGTILLARVPISAMRLALAVFTLLIVAYKFISEWIKSLQYQHRNWHGPFAGFLSGLASTLFNGGGPPFSSYLFLQKIPPRPFVATTAIFFAVLNVIKVPGFLNAGIINPPLLASVWWVVFFIPLGIWVAQRLINRINRSAFEWLIVALLFLSSVLLILQSR